MRPRLSRSHVAHFWFARLEERLEECAFGVEEACDRLRPVDALQLFFAVSEPAINTSSPATSSCLHTSRRVMFVLGVCVRPQLTFNCGSNQGLLPIALSAPQRILTVFFDDGTGTSHAVHQCRIGFCTRQLDVSAA